MKGYKFLLLTLLAVGMTLASCSSSDDIDQPTTPNGEPVTVYLNVSVNGVGNVPGMSGAKANTRAVDGYENGDAATEGKVNSARFYLFNADGSAYILNNGSGKSYIEPDQISTNPIEGGDPTTVESRAGQATIVIEGYSGNLPARIAAVVNQGAFTATGVNVLKDQMSEKELAAAELTTNTYNNSTAGFLMSNSVYQDVSGNAPLLSTPIDASHYKPTRQLALTDDPVNIYVERVAARVDVKKGSSGWNKTKIKLGETEKDYDVYSLSDVVKYYDPANYTDEKTQSGIYLVVEGWGLADQTNTASLVKQFNMSNYTNLASSSAIESEPISNAGYHRSFWETTPATYTPIRKNFNQYASDDNNNSAALEGKLYTFPNTPTTGYTWDETNRRTEVTNVNAAAPTKIVVVGRLMTKTTTTSTEEGGETTTTWTPLEVCKYLGQNYLGINNLKTVIANRVAHSTDYNIYIKTSENKYESIPVDDIDFDANTTPGSKDSYKVTAKLVKQKDGADITYYSQSYNSDDKKSEYKELTYDQANTRLSRVAAGDIEIYREGRTYYYTTLQHIWFPTSDLSGDNLATNEAKLPGANNVGAWGVVRNHIYRVTLASISGLGTPVYEPSEDIIPVTPSDQNSYLGASINVLQWRVVSQEANLDGKTKDATSGTTTTE